ncbi:DUF881 domain-containing protein [Peterkaempfera griseoplana]|uniref:DUF881 domain-containing protein n=1 Tax=Peterkaempfera griseoplana TaxID=66896 RepID=UPI0006E45CF7
MSVSGNAGRSPAERGPAARIVGRVLTCAVFALAGLLFCVSALTAQGTNLRTDDSLLRLTDVIREKSEQNQQTQHQVSALQHRVDALAEQQGQNPADIRRLAALSTAAGLEPLKGPGLTVTLNDAPPGATARIPGVPEPGPNDLVIHQQDIQAVVNALWRGGAKGVQVMDQRLIATSAVRCVGNTLILQGRVYSPPYVVRAVGSQAAMQAAVDADPYISNYLQYVNAYGLGWKVDQSGAMTLPGYNGSVDLRYAQAVP